MTTIAAVAEVEYCLRERRETRWTRSGGQNGSRPVSTFWRCLSCGRERVALGEPTSRDPGARISDVDGLARSIVSGGRRGVRPSLRDGRTVDASAESEAAEARLDYDDALGHVTAGIYAAYVDWNPAKNPSLVSWATFKGRCAMNDWYRETLGRDTPKAHTWALSSDAMTVDDDEEVSVTVRAVAAFAEGSMTHPLILIEDAEISETLRLVVLPIALGYSHAEVAELHGQTEAWVTGRLRKLRAREDLRIPA